MGDVLATTQATLGHRRPDSATAGPPAVRLFVGGALLSDDLAHLLYKRLRFGATLCLAVYLYFVAVWGVTNSYRVWEYTWVYWVYFVLIHAAFLGEAVSVAVLWARRGLSLRQLRLLELLVIGLPVLHQTWFAAYPLFGEHVLLRHLQTGAGPHDTSRSHVFTWFVLLVAYGVLIPNTWRRLAVILCALSLVAFGLNFAAAARDGVLAHAAVVQHLAEVAVWLGFGTAFAVYNAYRIDVLRAQTRAARQLGQYTLRERLGAGGMGEVYRAEHALLRRPCAVKLIRPERAGDPAALARFAREVQATAALTHPHVVRIHDYGRADDGTFYCVMEYLPGVTLDELVRRHGPVPPGRAVFFLRQLCSALAEAHAAGLTHRDVKPGNVIVRAGGRQADFATLLDFGLVLDRAAADDRATREGALVGTPAFMAPEQAGGERVDQRADVYAIGAAGYFLLTGRPPFQTGSALKTVAAVLTEPPPPLGRPGVPAGLEAVVLRCLAKSPAGRFASAEELDAALSECGCDGWSHAEAAEWWRGAAGAADGARAETGTYV
jgi:serine/threonine-protein kinase